MGIRSFDRCGNGNKKSKFDENDDEKSKIRPTYRNLKSYLNPTIIIGFDIWISRLHPKRQSIIQATLALEFSSIIVPLHAYCAWMKMLGNIGRNFIIRASISIQIAKMSVE